MKRQNGQEGISMSQDVATSAAALPQLMLSLPQRLAVLAGAVGTVVHPGQPVRFDLYRALTSAERAEAEQTLLNLTSTLDPMASFEGHDAGMAKAILLTKLVRGLAGPKDMSDLVAQAKIEMYASGLQDANGVDIIPAWALDKAIKRWARGSCPAEIEASPNFNWPPSPATLRALADDELDLLRRNKRMVENLLAAMPIERAMDPTPVDGGPKLPALRRM